MSFFAQLSKAVGIIFGLKSDSQGERVKKNSPRKKNPAANKRPKIVKKKFAAKGRSSSGRRTSSIPSPRTILHKGKNLASSSKAILAKGRFMAKAEAIKLKELAAQGKAENNKKVGEITHYFGKISVAVVRIDDGPLIVGDKIKIIGDGTNFVQVVRSMQVESVDVKVAKRGQLVGLKVNKPVHPKDNVYKY